ncbi:MAG: biotin carboxylase N-terminal domain-containing protein, partial [Pseudomonadales bacterium]
MHRRLLIANRGEIALRIQRAANDLGIETVAVFADDDAQALHVRRAGQAVALGGRGVKAYLDSDRIIGIARETGCDALHPGYGFLAENAAFARAANAAGITFVGPRADLLDAFGAKTTARSLARAAGIAVLPGTEQATSLEEVSAFFDNLSAGQGLVIKALAGGGGRGMRIVTAREEIPDAYARCASEALAAFGDAGLYVERLVQRARHLEVQIAGDQHGAVTHLWERECTLQRRHQKLVEIAPSPSLTPAQREQLLDAALRLARHVRYENLGTLEFLLDVGDDPSALVFIEGNARLQVEHTVTEEITGVDLVRTQLGLAAGLTLQELGLATVPAHRGRAVQVRVNMETMQPDGSTRPAGGTLTTFDVPCGRGVRVETFGYAGFTTSPAFDSLLAKVIVHSPDEDLALALRAADRTLAEFTIEGVATNIPFLRALLNAPAVLKNEIYTRYVETDTATLVADSRRYDTAQDSTAGRAGATVDQTDPLAVLKLAQAAPRAQKREDALADGLVGVPAPMQGTIVSVEVAPGATVRAGQPLVVMDAMKMEHVITAPVGGTVRQLEVAAGDILFEGHRLLVIEADAAAGSAQSETESFDLEHIRPDLAEVRARHAYGLDENRPDAVARRHGRGHRTARENVADLVDDGSFVEYGALMIAAQRRRRTVQDLMEKTSGDGMVAGIGTVNADLFGTEHSRVMAMSYDYMVLAGTQGHMN